MAQVIGSLCREERQPSKVMSGCLLCMGELVKSLGPHAIPLLPSLLPSVLKHLSGKKDKARYACVYDVCMLNNIHVRIFVTVACIVSNMKVYI